MRLPSSRKTEYVYVGRASSPDDWRAADVFPFWGTLDGIERMMVCSSIITEQVRREAERKGWSAERVLGCLRLCALEAGYPVNLTM